MYADTDFFLAMLKEEDWLKKRAVALYGQKKGEIWTSVATMVEIMFKAAEKNMPLRESFLGLEQLTPIFPLTKDHLITAAEIKEQNPNMRSLDSIHAAVAQLAGEKKIISSDKIFEQLGFERIGLEK